MSDLSVIYSVGVTLNGGGYGTTAWYAVRGIHRNGYLKRVIAIKTFQVDLPKEKIRTPSLPIPKGLLYRILPHAIFADAVDSYFDWAATRSIEPCDILHAWVHQMNRQVARARSLGARIVTNGASSHPQTQVRLVQEEYARFGVSAPVMSQRAQETSSRDLADADHIIAASEFVVKSLAQAGIDEKKISLVPFGVDSQRFKPGIKRDNVFRVLFSGTITLRKGVQYLLQAWDELRLKNAELWIVGLVTPDAAKLVAKYRSREEIIFSGFIPDPVDAYQQSSLFVFPSIEEGSALVTYEAMACGLPVIVSENSGSIARDGVDGYMVPIRDVVKLKEHIEKLYQNTDLRHAMGQSARLRAQEFTWEKYGDGVVAAYRKLMGQK